MHARPSGSEVYPCCAALRVFRLALTVPLQIDRHRMLATGLW